MFLFYFAKLTILLMISKKNLQKMNPTLPPTKR